MKDGDRAVFNPYRDMELDDYEPQDQSQEKALAAVKDYMADWDLALTKGIGITFTGPPGVGKTMLASMVMKAAARHYSVRSIDMTSWINMYHRKFELGKADDGEDPDIHEEWWRVYRGLESIRRRHKVVLLDDVGKEYNSGSGWSNSTLDMLIRYRHNWGMPTILTSNLELRKWAPRYSPSLESFLHQSSIIITIDGDDYRKLR